MAPTYLQQYDPWVTQISNIRSYYTDSEYISYVTPTNTRAATNHYYQEYHHPKKKEETAKEKKIRQAAAFSSFYKSGSYSPRKSAKTIRAEQKERSKREDKFKSLNNNLII